MADEPVYEKPSAQLDLERRQENGNASTQVLIDSDEYNRRKEAGELPDDEGRDFAVEDNDLEGYVGVDPIYQNYANETEKPSVADEGAEAEVFKQVREDGETVKKVSEELKSDSEAERDTDDTSAAGDADVTTPTDPVSPPTPGSGASAPTNPSDSGVSSSGQ